VLGVTDHDTFAGYDQALPAAAEAGVELVCGIELSTKLHGQSVHLLGYFLGRHEGGGRPEGREPNRPAPADPGANGLGAFRHWVLDLQTARRERNVRLAARLRELGFDVTLEEAEARGRGMTGRPHFAQIMVEKGYVADIRQAFDDYLDESAKGYVYRREPQFAEGVESIRNAGGIASLAHPVRVKGDLPALMPELHAAGLNAIEAYHSDHGPRETELYLGLAKKFGMLVTGGSDFHGAVKPDVKLGTGYHGNLAVPEDLLERLRAG